MSTEAFSKHFSDIQDPRQVTKISYPLFDVLFLSVCSIICGADGWEEMQDFGETNLDWLQAKGLFINGSPTHDTIARIVSRLDPDSFRRCFIRWTQSICARTSGELVAIDGKTLRRSYNREDRQSAIHMVSAFASQNSVVLGQIKTEEKSNEITAIPALLELLDVKGCLVSIDAMGCQKNIAQTIIRKEADYLLAVKGNQETLHRSIKQAFAGRLADSIEAKHLQINIAHGRNEGRVCYVLPAQDLRGHHPEWPELKTIGVVIGYRQDRKTQKVSLEHRYYISSAELDESAFATAVRGHWGIENSLHWVLDASMNEDECPIYAGHGAEILATTRHIALNMLRAETSKKASIRRKQKMACMSTDYLDKVWVAGVKSLADQSDKALK